MYDCAGECGGSVQEDCFGICEGSGVIDCEGNCSNDLGNECDGCNYPDNSIGINPFNGDVLFSSTSEIGGFQMNIEGASIVSIADEGISGAYGLFISNSSTMIMGFSFTGTTIPPSCGTLFQLELAGQATGLSGIVISNQNGGEAIEFEQIFIIEDGD